MSRSALLPIRETSTEINIFSDKSSLILFWILSHHNQLQKDGFSIQELKRHTGTSVGLVHKVVKQLEYVGIVSVKGLRTNKRFYLKSPKKLLITWIKEYNLIKKTKTKGFAFFDTKLANQKHSLIPALHTACNDYFKLKSTNLRLKEFYLLDWGNLSKMTNHLDLQEMDRGYEILLIKPYYSSLLKKINDQSQNELWIKAYTLLTVLDLCHFPIRGIEQAEVLFRKTEFLKSICAWSEIENAIR